MTNEQAHYIAGKACEFLAELAGHYDGTGRSSEAIMCDWSAEPGSPGEIYARKLVDGLMKKEPPRTIRAR